MNLWLSGLNGGRQLKELSWWLMGIYELQFLPTRLLSSP